MSLLCRKCSRALYFSPFLAGVLCLLHKLSDPLRIRRGNIISCEAMCRKTKQLHKQRRESFQAMIEGNRCQIDSNFNNFYRTESGFGAPSPDEVIEGLILILSGSQHTLLQKLQLGQLSKYWLDERTQIHWELRGVLGWFLIIS